MYSPTPTLVLTLTLTGAVVVRGGGGGGGGSGPFSVGYGFAFEVGAGHLDLGWHNPSFSGSPEDQEQDVHHGVSEKEGSSEGADEQSRKSYDLLGTLMHNTSAACSNTAPATAASSSFPSVSPQSDRASGSDWDCTCKRTKQAIYAYFLAHYVLVSQTADKHLVFTLRQQLGGTVYNLASFLYAKCPDETRDAATNKTLALSEGTGTTSYGQVDAGSNDSDSASARDIAGLRDFIFGQGSGSIHSSRADEEPVGGTFGTRNGSQANASGTELTYGAAPKRPRHLKKLTSKNGVRNSRTPHSG